MPPTQTGCRSYPNRPIQLHSPGGVERPEHQRSLKKNWTTTHFMRPLGDAFSLHPLHLSNSTFLPQPQRRAKDRTRIKPAHVTSRHVASGEVRSGGEVRSSAHQVAVPREGSSSSSSSDNNAVFARGSIYNTPTTWKASVTHLTPKPVFLVRRVGELRHPHLHLGRCQAAARDTLADDPAVNELLHR